MAEWSKSQSPYPVQVTRWLKDQSQCDSVVDGLLKQYVNCAVYKRDIGSGLQYAVFRERLERDPEDIEDQRYFPATVWMTFNAPNPDEPGLSTFDQMKEIDRKLSHEMRLIRVAFKHHEWKCVRQCTLMIETLSEEKTRLAEQYKRECAAVAEQIERERKEVAA